MRPRVVFDSMLFLQQAARPDRVHGTFAVVVDGRVELCVSDALLAELYDILTRPEHQAKFPALAPAHVASFVAQIAGAATRVDPVPPRFTHSRHPDDDHVFNLSVAAGAHFLVTWETRHLLMAERHPTDAGRLSELQPSLESVDPPTSLRSLKSA